LANRWLGRSGVRGGAGATMPITVPVAGHHGGIPGAARSIPRILPPRAPAVQSVDNPVEDHVAVVADPVAPAVVAITLIRS
jgi:hypothetical protein